MKANTKVGSVTFWSDERGFGFVADDEGGPDHFCHHTAVSSGDVRVGTRLAYEIGPDSNGRRPKVIRAEVIT